MKTHYGQSLAEYSLYAGIMVTLVVGSFMALSDTFTNLFQQASGRLQATPLAAAVPLSNATETAAGGSNQSGTSASPPNFTSSLAPGAYQSIGEIIPYTEVEQLIETSGVSGVNNRLMEGLIVTAEAMKAAGELDEASANAIINLANQGFRIASIQEILDQRMSSGDDLVSIKNTPLSFEGKTVAFEELNGLIASYGVGGDQLDKQIGINDVGTMAKNGGGKEYAAFANLYNEVEASGALNNSALYTLVNNAALMVLKSSNTLNEVYSSHLNYSIQTNNLENSSWLQGWVKGDVSKMLKSATVEGSTTICNAGNGNVQEQTCQ